MAQRSKVFNFRFFRYFRSEMIFYMYFQFLYNLYLLTMIRSLVLLNHVQLLHPFYFQLHYKLQYQSTHKNTLLQMYNSYIQ